MPPPVNKVSAGFVRRKNILLWPLIVAIVSLAGCVSRPVGDFGRPEPSVLHDDLLPALGKASALHRLEPASFYRKTDEEKKLESLAWNAVRPMHTHDWISGALIESRRTRVLPNAFTNLDFRTYYRWLYLTPYTSSEGRWNRIIEDIRSDQFSVVPFYDQARLVYAIDGERLALLANRTDLTAWHKQNTQARVYENGELTGWVLHALEFRYASYEYAIKTLALETPSARSSIAYEELIRLSDILQQGAMDREFYGNDVSGKGASLPSRIGRTSTGNANIEDDVIYQK